MSCKKSSGAAQLAIPANAQRDLTQNLREKIAWLAHTWGIPPARILNLDETSLRLLPSSDSGWSERNEKAKQLVDGKRQVTCTLAMTMQPSSFGIHAQLIYAGKTPRVLPMGPMLANIYLDFSENNWQSCASLQGYVEHLDGLLNSTTLGLPWLLVLDAASTHVVTASGRRCTPRRSALDVSLMKAFKRAVARHTNQHFAMAILDAFNGEGEIALDCSMITLKAVLLLWVSQAITELGARSALCESAWEPLQWGTPAQFLEIVAAATAHHSEGTLFRTSGKQQVTPEQPPDISGEHEEADEHENDDDEALLLIDGPGHEPDPPPVETDAPLAEPASAEPAASASASGWSALSGMERLMTLRPLYGRRPPS